jgi:hypothetical protein
MFPPNKIKKQIICFWLASDATWSKEQCLQEILPPAIL